MLDDLNGAFLRAFVLTLLCSSFQGNCYRVEAGAEEEACHVMGARRTNQRHHLTPGARFSKVPVTYRAR